LNFEDLQLVEANAPLLLKCQTDDSHVSAVAVDALDIIPAAEQKLLVDGPNLVLTLVPIKVATQQETIYKIIIYHKHFVYFVKLAIILLIIGKVVRLQFVG